MEVAAISPVFTLVVGANNGGDCDACCGSIFAEPFYSGFDCDEPIVQRWRVVGHGRWVTYHLDCLAYAMRNRDNMYTHDLYQIA